MKNEEKTKVQLIEEVARLRRQIAELETSSVTKRASLAQQQAIVEAVPVPMIIIQPGDSQIRYVNEAACEFFGYSREELMARKMPVLLANETERAKLSEIFTDQGHLENFEACVCKADGSMAHILLSAQPFWLGGKPVILTTQIDITKLKQVEGALRESEQKFRSFIEQSPNGIALTDEEGRFIAWNDGCEQIIGLRREEVIGRYQWDVQFQFTVDTRRTPEKYERVKAATQKLLKTGQYPRSYPREIEIQNTIDGAHRFIHSATFPIQTENGFMIGFIFYDITERKRAERAQREHWAFTEALLDTALVLGSTIDLGELLGYMLEIVERVVLHDSAVVMLVEGNRARPIDYRGYGEEAEAKLLSLVIDENYYLKMMNETGEPVIVPDISTEPHWDETNAACELGSYLGIPIVLAKKVIGFLNLGSCTKNYFTKNHAQYLQIFAFQAALALQNAQLYEQAQAAAAMEERHRLARDLHDSVSQTLFSINSIAEALPRFIDKKPTKAREYMSKLEQLTRIAQAEMRTLLFELRPESLIKIHLAVLLEQLCDTFTGNTQIDVVRRLPGKIVLSERTKVVFYRVAQEALNNIAKHAHASRVEMYLSKQRNKVELRIRDDGKGFDPEQTPATHFGLRIMGERARSVGADLQIKSRPGQGTEIILNRTM